MTWASGRASLTASTTFRPLPSSSRMSSTAKAGGVFSTCINPSATVSAVHLEPAHFHGAREAFAQRPIVFDDQERSVGGKLSGGDIGHGPCLH